MFLSGIVELVTPDAIVVNVNNGQSHLKGTVRAYTTFIGSSYRDLADLLKSVLKPGYEFDQLLVLDIEGFNLVLSAKYSLISTAEQLPLDFSWHEEFIL
nr:rRNA biogenesis protein RRP5 isoform X1 [Ipomoea batatas]